jgi:integrase/recombinase XerD
MKNYRVASTKLAEDKEMTMQELIEEFRLSLGRERQNTALAYYAGVRQLYVHLATIGLNDWVSVTSEQVTGYIRDLSGGGQYRPSTVAQKCAAIKSFFRYLYGKGVVTQELLENVASFSVSAPEPRAPQILSQEQIERLFACVDGTTSGGLRDLAILQVLSTTGLLASELLSLDLTDFDAEGTSLSCPGQGGLRRNLPFSPVTEERIQRYLEHGRPLLVRSKDEQALFVNHLGARLSRQGLWLIVKGYAERVGIIITPRVLRHTSVVSMLRSGMELSQVQEALGYARSTSLQVYHQLVSCEEMIMV